MAKQIQGQMSIMDWVNSKQAGAFTVPASTSVSVSPLEPVSEITDFGNKIGGARKDLWGDDGTIGTSFSKSGATKRIIWPRPNYKKMVKDGKNRTLIYFIKKVYEAIPMEPKFPKYMDEKSKKSSYAAFYDMVEGLREYLVSPERTAEDVGNQYVTGFLKNEGYIKMIGNHRYICCSLEAESFITSKLVNTLSMTQDQIKYEAKKKQFLFSEEEKLLANYEIVSCDRTSVSVGRDPDTLVIKKDMSWGWVKYFATQKFPDTVDENLYHNGNFFVVQVNDHEIVKAGYTSIEEAQKELEGIATLTAKLCDAFEGMAKRNAADKHPAVKKRAYPFEHLQDIERKGGNDVRKGRDVTGDDYLKTFRFYGGEFGNWLGQDERQQVLNYGYDAFWDLADVLGIKPEQVTGNGKLSIAFGARGRGKALAHFEPDKCVINLTRMKGAGSLGHEMIHFFDYLCGRNLGYSSYLSEAYERLEDPKGIPQSFKALMQSLQSYVPHKGDIAQVTKFRQDAHKLGELFAKDGKGYWSSDVEMLARAGAAYLKDKLAERGMKNDYLVGHADTVKVETSRGVIYGAPMGEERKRINKAFDLFFSDMKARNII